MDKFQLGYIVGKRYRVWTGDVDKVLGYRDDGWVIVQDEKTGVISPPVQANHSTSYNKRLGEQNVLDEPVRN